MVVVVGLQVFARMGVFVGLRVVAPMVVGVVPVVVVGVVVGVRVLVNVFVGVGVGVLVAMNQLAVAVFVLMAVTVFVGVNVLVFVTSAHGDLHPRVGSAAVDLSAIGAIHKAAPAPDLRCIGQGGMVPTPSWK